MFLRRAKFKFHQQVKWLNLIIGFITPRISYFAIELFTLKLRQQMIKTLKN